MKLFTLDNRLIKSIVGELPALIGKELGRRPQSILRMR
jgi:hypothetical protein